MKKTSGKRTPWYFTALGLAAVAIVLLASSCGGTKPPEPAAPRPSQPSQAEPASTEGQTPVAVTPSAGDQAQPAGNATSDTQAAITPPATTEPAATDPAAAPPASASGAGATGAASAAQKKIGELVFTEGSVSIHRAGASPERGDIGSVVRQYDVLVTGPKSRAEIDLGSGSSGGASIKLAENTAFYFDTKELSAEQRKTVVQMLSGAVAIKVDRLANGSFSIATGQAVLGVRGTVFVVDSAPDGSILVTCESGAVAVTADGVTRTAKPGGVVELPEAGELRLLAVEPADLGKYRGDWRADAYKTFASTALTYTSAYAAALDAGKPAFDAAYTKLKTQEKTLDAWRAARAAGTQPRFTDWIVEKKAVSAVLFDCLKAAFALERPYYRLLELKALHAGGTGVGTMKDGRKSAEFFKAFESGNANLVLGMAKVREALLLFSWASAGSPLGDFFGAKADGLGTGSLFLEE